MGTHNPYIEEEQTNALRCHK